jgi:hypothetical protein
MWTVLIGAHGLKSHANFTRLEKRKSKDFSRYKNNEIYWDYPGSGRGFHIGLRYGYDGW